MADDPITDLIYIEQTSKANEQENLDFRAFVKADLDLSDYRLHGIVKQATAGGLGAHRLSHLRQLLQDAPSRVQPC